LEHETPPDFFLPVAVGVVVTERDSGAVVATFDGARGVSFNDSGDLLAVGTANAIEIVDTSTWTVVERLDVEGYTPDQVLWGLGDRHLVASGVDRSLGGERHLEVIAIDGRGVVARGPSGVVSVALSPDRTLLAAGLEGGALQLLRLADDGSLGDLPVGVAVADLSRVTGLAFSPDSRLLVTSGVRSTIVWDVRVPSAPRQVQVVSDLPAWRFGGVQETDVVGAPTTARGAWGLVAFRPDGESFVIAGGSGAVELPDYDPALACRQATEADFERLETLLGAPSACLRVPGLRD
jgi:WD40 repeat protein